MPSFLFVLFPVPGKLPGRARRAFTARNAPVLQGVFRAVFHTFHAKDTLRTVFPFPGRIRHIHIHRADTPALAAGYAFAFVAFHPQHGKIAHGLCPSGKVPPLTGHS